MRGTVLIWFGDLLVRSWISATKLAEIVVDYRHMTCSINNLKENPLKAIWSSFRLSAGVLTLQSTSNDTVSVMS